MIVAVIGHMTPMMSRIISNLKIIASSNPLGVVSPYWSAIAVYSSASEMECGDSRVRWKITEVWTFVAVIGTFSVFSRHHLTKIRAALRGCRINGRRRSPVIVREAGGGADRVRLRVVAADLSPAQTALWTANTVQAER